MDYKDYKYWFLVKNESQGDIYNVFDKATFNCIGQISCSEGEANLPEAYQDKLYEIVAEFAEFTANRLEAKLWDISDTTSSLADKYIMKFKGAIAARSFKKIIDGKYPTDKNIDEVTDAIMKHLIGWLSMTDFFTAPASTIYHNSYPSGLVAHTLEVVNQIINLHVAKPFKSVDISSAILCALMHDWCKIGLYEPYQKNVKNDETGKWEQVTAYKHNQQGVPLGHGAASMFLANKIIYLDVDEALAIRWHMGEYNVAQNEMNELHLANETYPLVQLLQFADRLSITKYI